MHVYLLCFWRRMTGVELFFIVLSIFAGGLLTVQAAANAQLASALGSPLKGAAAQLALGALLLFGVAAAAGELSALSRLGDGAWWHAAGGVASAVYVVSAIVLYPRIGAVLAVGLIIAGQMLASLALDLFGLFGVAQRAADAGMLAGAAAVVAGAFAIAWGGANAGKGRWPLLALGLAAGAVLPVQGAVNGLLRDDIGAAIAAALVSFMVATAAMLIAMGVSRRAGSGFAGPGSGLAAMPWWGWLGALCGATYVTTVFSAMPAIGASTTIGLTVFGQQAASLVVDGFGLLRLPARRLSAARVTGVALLMAGVLLIRFA